MPDDAPDRRAGPRFGPQFGVAVDCRPDGGPNAALALIDLSAGGCRLHAAAPLGPGRAVALAFRPPGGRAAVRVTGRVVWACPLGGVAHAVGVAFDRPLGGDELIALADLGPGPIGRPLADPDAVAFDPGPDTSDEPTERMRPSTRAGERG